jgi:hypothetical protein
MLAQSTRNVWLPDSFRISLTDSEQSNYEARRESLFSARTDMCVEYVEVLYEARHHEIPHATRRCI